VLIVVVLVYLIGCGFMTRWLAQRRGIPGGNMLIGTGMLFGIVAVAFYAFRPPKWFGGEKR